MARTEREVIRILREIYEAEFGGKRNQRYLISWGDLRAIYGFSALYQTRFDALVEEGRKRRLYLLDLGEGETGRLIAVLRTRTVDRWRRVPRKIIDEFRMPPDEDGDEEAEDEC
jgi:hypothetical protein